MQQCAHLCCGVTVSRTSQGRPKLCKQGRPKLCRAAVKSNRAAHLCCGVTVSRTSEGVMMSLTLVLLDCLPLTTTLLR
jgi:hypothetical protein